MARNKGGVQVIGEFPTLASGGQVRGDGTNTRAVSPRIMAALDRPRTSGPNSGFYGDWFPPLAPFPAQAPDDVKGRAFNYPFGVNLDFSPRQEGRLASISFEMLRRMAEPSQGGLDLLRLAIETRKKQMKAQRFKIQGREKNDDGGPEARALELLLRKPDGVHGWKQWISMLLEDHYVIDAPTVYMRPTSQRPLFELIDGAMIKVVIDSQGRTPQAPLPAYGQLVIGLPAVYYTTDELGYYVDNPRTDKLYGMSPVEQVIGIVSIALNRQLSILNYYTAGSVPDMLVGVPETWNTDEIAHFQEYWDSLLAGNLDARRKARFVPGNMKPYETKTEVLKDLFDEWLARVICFAFNLPVTALVKETNRATAETSKEQAAEEGLESSKNFVKDVVDDILLRCAHPELELQWEDEEIQDPLTKAKVVMMYYGGETGGSKPIITLNRAREMIGEPPATPEDLEELQPPEPDPMDSGSMNGSPAGSSQSPQAAPSKTGPAADDKQVSKAAKSRGGRSLPKIRPNRKLKTKVERGIRSLAAAVLAKQRKIIVSAIQKKTTKLAKASAADLRELLHELDANPWDETARQKLRDLLAELSQDRTTAALDRFGDYIDGTDGDFSALLQQANAKSVEWAQERAGNMITEVSRTTRDSVNELVAASIEDGATNEELASILQDAFGFSSDRAAMIARTETNFAESQGALIGYKESGVVSGKEWDPDNDPCPECEDNANAGTIGLDEDFPSGDDAPPAHPNCECVLVPVVDESVFQFDG